jgi:hypothetical protein
MKRLLLACLISFNAIAQSTDELVKVRAPKVNAQVGQEVLIKTFVSVKNGYHIQAHEIADELIIPTTLEIAEGKNFVIKKQVFPPTKKFTLTGTNQNLEVYDGEFEIQTSLEVSLNVQKGNRQLRGILNYQACDSVRCLFPRRVEFLVNVHVQ